MLENRNIIETISSNIREDLSLSEIKELDEQISNKSSEDFCIEFIGMEYRIIGIDNIDEILKSSLEDLIDECYDIPEGWISNYIRIDYDRMASDTCPYEHFGSYNGNGFEDNDFYYFRTN